MNKYEIALPFLRDLDARAEVTQTALILPDSLEEIQWERIGYGLTNVAQSTQWWVGDWWAFGEHKYGDRKELVQSEDWTGPAFDTCQRAGQVCRKFEATRRRSLLSFEHHKVAAPLDPAQADELLDWALEPLKKSLPTSSRSSANWRNTSCAGSRPRPGAT